MNKNLLWITSCVIILCSCQKNLKEIISETEKATFTVYTYYEFGSPLGIG